jgi:hypothetical protein
VLRALTSTFRHRIALDAISVAVTGKDPGLAALQAFCRTFGSPDLGPHQKCLNPKLES